MIIDLSCFIAEERPKWARLDAVLKRLADDPWRELSLPEVRELEQLYQRASADLARLTTFAAEADTQHYLESLVARAYSEVHGAHAERKVFRPWPWFAQTLPQTFRRHFRAFVFSFVLMLAGALFGGFALSLDRTAKQVIMPFSHLQQTPSQRVASEEKAKKDHLEGHHATFAGMLMQNNIKVTFTALALGLSYGIGTIILMFYNGVILGAVVVDYIADGQTTFLLGWLLPHGVIEIPAMLIGGQAGFVLATSLLQRGDGRPLAARIRAATSDVVTLAFGAALLLVWAGLIESFLSQHHEPTLPYSVKIAFGIVELAALIWFLAWAGKRGADSAPKATAFA